MRVIIVDDDPVVAISMKTILMADKEVEVPEVGADGEDALVLYDKYKPDVLLMDIQMKRMSGLEAAQIIMKKYPDARIVILTTFMDKEYIRTTLKTGCKGYILKQDFEGVLPAIKAVYSGQNVFGNEIINALPDIVGTQEHKSYADFGLTDKEAEIVELVADGLSNKEIASKLFLSDGTVRNYISTVLEKLELRDRTQLAVFYYKNR